MAANPQEEDEERLLDDVVVMVDVTSNEIRNIVVRQLENWGRPASRRMKDLQVKNLICFN